jgi:hypothetical protein
MNCPHCGSTRIRRSRTRGFGEKFLKFFGYKAYRCREADCGWRGLVKTRAASRKLFQSIEIRKEPLILAIIILFFGLLLLFDLLRE